VSQRDYRILIGTAGWQHPEWGNEVFYPEDLPEDWFLSFYANEFPIVLIPEQDWSDVDAVEQLVEEINEQATAGFKCVFELDWTAQNNINERLEKLSTIGSFLSGLSVLTNVDTFEDKAFCDAIISLCQQFKLCIELKDKVNDINITKARAFCEKNSISLTWMGEGEIVVPEKSQLWITRCNSEQENKPLMQQIKKLIAEQLKRENLSREHILLVDGQPPKVEAVRNAMIMMDLM